MKTARAAERERVRWRRHAEEARERHVVSPRRTPRRRASIAFFGRDGAPRAARGPPARRRRRRHDDSARATRFSDRLAPRAAVTFATRDFSRFLVVARLPRENDSPPPAIKGHLLQVRERSAPLREMDDENLPPLEWEPGVAGRRRSGVSAVVIAFGGPPRAVRARGVTAAYLALCPSAGSTQLIAADAMDAVSMDPSVADALGTPLRSYAIDHGTSRGRRNAMERWDREEIGADGDPAEYTTIRFHVAGPLGAAASTRGVGEAAARRAPLRHRRGRRTRRLLRRRQPHAGARSIPNARRRRTRWPPPGGGGRQWARPRRARWVGARAVLCANTP